MDQQRWVRVKEIVFAALGREPAARRAFVVDATEGDEEVRLEALSLLDQDLKTSYVEGISDLPIGATADDLGLRIANYEILGVVGRGGMGTVYKARDIRLGRLAALKVLLPHLVTGDVSPARFMNEARAAARLEHPNICTVYDVGKTESGVPYIATSFIDGMSVRGLLRQGKLSVLRTIDIVSKVLDALHTAHAAGIIHRDVKPSNIMVAKDGSVRIVDFGIATILGEGEGTKTGATVGTMSFMSPERIQGQPSDHRADIWSVGVVLYEMLTGQRPFGTGDPDTIGYQVVHRHPESLFELEPDLPAALVEIVSKCLAKNPAERYQDAFVLNHALQQVKAIAAGDEIEEVPADDGAAELPERVLLGITALLALLLVSFVLADRNWARISVKSADIGFEGAFGDRLRSRVLVAPFSHLTGYTSGKDFMIQALVKRELSTLLAEYSTPPSIATQVVDAVDSESEALALMDSLGAHMVIWGETSAGLGQVEIESRVTVPASIRVLDDSVMSIPAALQIPPWNGASIRIFGDDLLQTRVFAAERTAEIALTALLVRDALHSDRPEAALLAIKNDSTIAGLAELKASTLLRLGLLSEARQYLEWSTKAYPRRAGLCSIYATLLAVMEDVTGATRMAQQAIYVDGLFAYAHLQMAHLEDMVGNQHSATLHLEEANHVAQAGAKSDIAEALTRRYVALGNYQDAERLLANLIPAGQNYSRWHASLADLYIREGRPKEATFLLEQLVTLNPDDVRPLEELARLFRQLGQVDRALATTSRLIGINAAAGHRLESEWFLEDERLTEAVKARRLAIEAGDRPVVADYDHLGDIYMRLGRYEDAIKTYKRGIAASGDGNRFAAKLASAYLHNRMPEQALRIAQLAGVEDPGLGHRALMDIYRQLGLFEQAQFHAQRFLAIAPQDANRHAEMAITLYLSGQFEESFPYFERAVRAHPANASNYLRYAFALHRSGRSEEAYRELESYLEYTRYVQPTDASGFSDEIVQFFLGMRSEADLLDPPAGSEVDSLWMMASGHAVIGMAYLLDFGRNLEHEAPDTMRAVQSLQESLHYGKHTNATRDLVLAELEKLER